MFTPKILNEDASPKNDAEEKVTSEEKSNPLTEEKSVPLPTRRENIDHVWDGWRVLPHGNPDRKWLVIPEYMRNMTLYELRHRQDLATNVATKRQYKMLCDKLCREQEQTVTSGLLDKRLVKKKARGDSKRAERGIFVTQSGKGDMNMTNTEEQHENVVAHDGESSVKMTIGKSPVNVDVGSKEQHDIQQFFERPVTIYDSTWSDSTEYNVNLSVWDLWTKDAAVRAKLSHYAFFKGTLHVKISFSGTPFHYGMVLCSYQPFPDCNYTLLAYDDLLTSTVPTSANILPCYKSYLSQAPGATYINIQHNEPKEIVIPMVLPKQTARLWNDSNNLITNATSFEDLDVLGDLRLVTLNTILCANEDYTNAVSVNVQAWATDVELSVITGTNIDITAEARRRRRKPAAIREEAREIRDLAEDVEDDAEEMEEESSPGPWDKYTRDKPMYDTSKTWGQRISNTIDRAGDEYDTPGPVSHIASSISKAGEALSDVPVIGSFAKATSTVASKIGKVASWFGFSRPIVIEKTLRTKLEPFSNGAHVNYFDTSKKITLDPKQELTIDQGLGGNGDDDCMAIKHITSRESFVHTFRWDRTSTAMSTTLWETLITPMIFNTCPSASSKSIVQPTSLAFAAQVFSFWRGSITWRFEIVCSKFHRGKLMFKFEPNFSQAVLISSDSTKLNQQNTLIVDIQEVQNVEITIPFISDRAWKVLDSSGSKRNKVTCDVQGGNLDYSDYTPDHCCGWLQVRPLNELVQPTDDGDVAINCYVKSTDMEFAAPSKTYVFSSQTYTETESGEIVKNNICQIDVNNDHIYEHHFGEKVESFRSLLKRYETALAMVATASGANAKGFTFNHNIYPPSTNYPSSGTSFTSDDGEPCLFNYLRYAYMGVRGGYRWRYVISNTHDVGTQALLTTSLENGTTSHYMNPNIAESTLNSHNNLETNYSYIDGAVRHMTSISGGHEVEVPFYTNDLFNFAWAPRFGINEMGTNILSTVWSGVRASYSIMTESNDKVGITCDCAAAEDFTFLRYQGAPFRVEDT